MQEKNTIKVLIADDSRLTVVALRTALKHYDFIEIIDTVEDGRQALESVKRLKPDIVLMDIGMPVMDGINATREINKLALNTKIIMLTSHDAEQEVFDALSAGAHSYCLKDIEHDILVTVIKTTHNGASWLDPAIAQIVLNNFMNKPSKTIKPEENSLTEREVSVLSLIAKGFSNSEISETLYISTNTVKTHIKNIFQKLEVEDRTHAAMKAFKNELIQ